MNVKTSRRLVAAACIALAGAFPLFVPAQTSAPTATLATKDKDEQKDEEIVVLSSFCISTSLGATPGGAQDIGYFRMGAGRGEIPQPDAITAEGLFSEHDLPLEVKDGGDALFIVQTAAAEARFEVLPEVRYLAQLGFSSGLRADTWTRAPLNLVAVVDKSGSMSGEPLALVRASLLSALDHLREGDQISIVLYGDRAHVHLDPTPVRGATRAQIAARIRAIESAGSTAMEEGLRAGYDVARQTMAGFKGTTRVMLFTDERPNVGNTEAAGFMGMAEAASREGIGLTTIGVGVQFGAELATKISSVRGGNLFFFEDGSAMKKTFASDFDTMVTELAHEFHVRITPAAGLRIAGVFGVPGEMLRWEGDAIVFDVASIFLSRRKGAIYVALAPRVSDDLPTRAVKAGEPLAQVDLGYTGATDGRRVTSRESCRLLGPQDMQLGLSRGAMLVDEYLTLKKAASVHLFDNDQERAFRLVNGLLARLGAADDAALAPELKLVADVHGTLALLSGHVGEMQPAAGAKRVSPLVGVWRGCAGGRADAGVGSGDYLVVWANGVIDFITSDERAQSAERSETLVLDGKVPRRARGTLRLHEADRARVGSIRYALAGDTLAVDIARGPSGGPEHLEFVRCVDDSDADEGDALAGESTDEIEIDELTGLPASRPDAG
jgi:Ca-activated chloride channel family protein